MTQEKYKTFKIDYVDIYEGKIGNTTIEAEDLNTAIEKFEEQSDGCTVVIIKELKYT